ncbi:MAG: winged helix-turn-helix domain-containing protein [Actinomycetota bacterium]|jgi:DNA-binding SARP family transcriptional activator|nr:winged helix-turn-helix domain-containing protein [Actinomycetota bacterium]
MQGVALNIPAGYYLERDPDLLFVRRSDGSLVTAFSARGAALEEIQRAVEEVAHPRVSGPRAVPDIQPSLWARCFGRFELFQDGEAVSLGRNGRAQTILKYLMTNRVRPVSQDYLMGWLWPESNAKKARWSLNSAMHALRKILGDCPTSSNYVLLDEGRYRLCPALRVSTDVDEFDDCYERGRFLERDGRMTEAASEYGEALALYRDDYLIEDLYEDWTMIERERLSNAYIDVLCRLASHYIETEQFQECIRACYLVLEKDRCHENSHRLLMESYARLGLRALALRQYRLCERVLDLEYGLKPSPETQALHGSFLKR